VLSDTFLPFKTVQLKLTHLQVTLSLPLITYNLQYPLLSLRTDSCPEKGAPVNNVLLFPFAPLLPL
jgi:hypothetical protein